MVVHRQPAIELRIAVALVCWWAVASCGWAQNVGIFREHHAWGRFAPESWVLVRKLTEEFDDAGQVRMVSTTETKTSLVAVDDFGCTLRVAVAVDVAGKRFAAQPRTVRIGYYGESESGPATLRSTGGEILEIGGKRLSCLLLEATVNSAKDRIVSTIHYCESVAPFVLKRETTVTDASGQQMRRQTTVDTLALEMPYKVAKELRTVAYLRTLERTAQGTVCTIEVYCLDIPGAVVAHSSKEFGAAGQLVRRSTLELLDYATVQEQSSTQTDSPLRHRVRRPWLPQRAK